MSRHKSRVVRFLLCTLACVLICAAFASELPEQLTLTNDTSNDYSFRPSTSLKSIQTLNSLRQDSSFFLTTNQQHSSWCFLLSVPGRASLQVESLLYPAFCSSDVVLSSLFLPELFSLRTN